MSLEAALNGAKPPGSHPALPLHPPDLAASALTAMRAGAVAIHFHARAADGSESLDPPDVDAALTAMRAACGPLPLGLSTGAWIVPDPEARLAAVRRWRHLPDFASVNFHEPGAAELADALLARDVGVEAGLTSADAAQAWIGSNSVRGCLRILIEPQETDLSDALRTVEVIERLLTSADRTPPRLLHGCEATAWPLLDVARSRGYWARIGLEDTLHLPDGRVARDNAELVAVALGRHVIPAMTPLR